MIESKGYKITPIDGDLAVSRNAEIGGDADIQGKARVAGSLKIEGFIDAPNIKGAVKGLFATEEELKREYPNPRPGWCAIVLADDESGFLYLAKNREWEKQSEEAKPFEFIADSINVFASKGELAEETRRAQSAENQLQLNIETEAGTRADAVNEIKGKAVLFGTFASRADAEGLLVKYENINHYEGVFSIPVATEEKAGIVSAADKKKFVKSITWNNDNAPSNMNDFTIAGVYDIKGERTRVNDNLPILNTGDGHSFNARLTVLDSSITGSGKDDDKCITQVLSFSNRLGQGEVYIRTGKGSSLDSLTWENWGTLQRNVNVGEAGSLDDLKDNGIYSGVWVNGHLNNYPLTFVCVVINDYFIGTSPRRISQFLYGLSKFDGSTHYQSRVWDDSKDMWSDWEILNQKEISSMITKEGERLTAYINSVVADAKRDILDGIDPDKIDSIKDIVAWIDAHGGDVTAIYNAIQQNTVKINAEISRAKEVEQAINNKLDEEIERSVAADQDLLRSIDEEARRANEAEEAIKNKAVEADSLNFQTRANVVALDYKTIEGVGDEITIPAATTENAGVMSSEDKVTLDSIPNEIEKIKDGDTIVGQAREIHSRNGKTVTDSFLARTTAGGGTIGDGVATLKSVGGNIVKNLVDGTFESGWIHYTTNTSSINKDISTIASSGVGGVKYSVSPVAGHIYYISVMCKVIYGELTFLYGNALVKATNKDWHSISYRNAVQNASGVFIRNDDPNSSILAFVRKPLGIDLTEMFGAGNEPSKEECDKLFGTMDALPQGLTIANPTEFKSTGWNQFNPDMVLVNKAVVDGVIVDGDKTLAIIPCLPCKIGEGENNGYCIHGDFGEDIKVYLTPLNPMEVDGELYMHELTKDATTDTYVPLIKGYMLVEVPTTANLCAHFLWSEDCDRNTFEPYYESKVELPRIPEMSEYGLAGISNAGQPAGRVAYDELNFEKGVYIKKIGCVDLGTIKWVWNEQYGLFRHAVTTPIPNIADSFGGACAEYPFVGNYANAIDGSIGSIFTSYLFVKDSRYTDANALKTALQGVMFYYELAEPEEYPLPKVANNYTSSDYGVEQFDGALPCNANNLYYMRSLAGETRNFLDKMYDNTAKTDAKEVADYITSGIEENKKVVVKLAADISDLKNDLIYKSKNLLNPNDPNIQEGYYQSNNKPVASSNYNLSGYIAVKPNTNYHFSTYTGGSISSSAKLRFTSFFDADKNNLGVDVQNTSDITTTDDTAYIRITVANNLTMAEVMVEEGNAYTGFEPYGYEIKEDLIPEITEDKLSESLRDKVNVNVASEVIESSLGGYVGKYQIGDITANNLCETTIFPIYPKICNNMSFNADIAQWGDLTLGKGYQSRNGIYIKITSTELQYIWWYSESDNKIIATVEHGLNIAQSAFIRVAWTSNLERKHQIVISCESGMFVNTQEITYDMAGKGFVLCEGTLTNAVLNYSNNQFKQPIWVFGDSYTSITSDRWTGVLFSNGVRDYMLCGHPGGYSQLMYNDAVTCLNYGTPKYIVWCLGMNDRINGTYNTYMQQLKAICENKGIQLILMRIPQVPTPTDGGYKSIEEAVNQYVVLSGLPYIDAYKAVGATDSGTWYQGMLSSDNVHPTKFGAQAIASQVLVDFPQLLECTI